MATELVSGVSMLRQPAFLYTSFYVGQFLFLGVQLPFFPGWLHAQGFSESAIGWVMGSSLMLRLIFGPMVAYWAESQTDQRKVFGIIAGVMAFSSGLLVVGLGVWAIAVLTILATWAFGCLVPITDTAVMRADKAGELNYGRARGLGSFAFIIANLFGGLIITRYGDQASVIWMAMASMLTVLIALSLPKGSKLTTHGGEQKASVQRPNLREAARLFRSKSFILMLIATGMTQGAHATYYYFSELHWSELGYTSDLIGLLWTLGVIAEIGILYYGRRFIAKYGAVSLITIGAFGAVIRWPLTGLSPPLEVLVLLQCMHALTFAATYLGSVEFISRAIPANLSNTGMTLVSTLGVGALTGVAVILVGFVFTPDNPLPGYMMMSAMGSIGLVASLLLAKRWDGGIIRTERAHQTGPDGQM